MMAHTPEDRLFRATHSQETVGALKAFLHEVQSNRVLLLEIVLAGYFTWMQRSRRAFHGLAVDDAMLGQLWGWMAHRRGPNPAKELAAHYASAQATQQQQATEASAMAGLYERARRRYD